MHGLRRPAHKMGMHPILALALQATVGIIVFYVAALALVCAPKAIAIWRINRAFAANTVPDAWVRKARRQGVLR